jgi:predicted phosphoadenosine phosphosulfate sulfurtransferase
MTYIHVQIPVNLTTIYQQAQVMWKHFNKLINHPLPDNAPKTFSKEIKTTVNFYLKRLERKMNQFKNIDTNLPRKSNSEKRHVSLFKSIDPINS